MIFTMASLYIQRFFPWNRGFSSQPCLSPTNFGACMKQLEPIKTAEASKSSANRRPNMNMNI